MNDGATTVAGEKRGSTHDVDALRARRAALERRLEAIAADIGRGLDADWEEQAVELENAEVLDEIARVTRVELARVERALARLSATERRG